MEQWLTVTQARSVLIAEYGLTKSREAIQLLCREGRITCAKPGRDYLIPPEGIAQAVKHFRRETP